MNTYNDHTILFFTRDTTTTHTREKGFQLSTLNTNESESSAHLYTFNSPGPFAYISLGQDGPREYPREGCTTTRDRASDDETLSFFAEN